MEQSTPKTGKFALNFGLILGAIGIVFGLMLYSLDMHYQNDWKVGIVSMVIMIVVITLAIKNFKKANGGYLSLGQGLKVGLGVAMVSAVVTIIFNLLLSQVIDPEMINKSLEFQRNNLAEYGLTTEQIDAQMAIVEKSASPGIQAAIALVGSLFLGFIFSLISSLIMKRSED
jgi:hypothetical protein